MFHVKHRPETDALDLPPDVDRAAFRVVQEALSNAPGADVRLTIERGRDTFAVTIHNDPPKTAPAEPG